MTHRPFTTLFAAALAFGVHAQAPQSGPESVPAPRVEPQMSLDDMRAFADVFGYIKDHYVEDIDDRVLLQAAIRGMLDELDPHSAWLSAEALSGVNEQTTGRYGGLGVELEIHDGYLEVVTAMDDTPAAAADLRPGDRILAIDGRALAGTDSHAAINRLRGEPGTSVSLTVAREGGATEDMLLTRRVISVASVKGERIEGEYGYVRISSFQHDTAASLDDTFADLQAGEPALSGLVLDLRSNPGGVLSASVAVADRFLDDGLIVYTEGRTDDSQLDFEAHPGGPMEDIPLVVLVDQGTASAAEIVAGALQAHDRALILGERTFGKGSVQTIMPLRNGSGMRLTTARYYTPDGRSIQARGIDPDVPVGHYRLVAREAAPERREADLERHLPAAGDRPAMDNGNEVSAETDYALYEALNLLKGARLLSRQQVGE